MLQAVTPPTLDDLVDAVDKASQRTVIQSAHELREMCGESRLKALARERVQEKLQQRGVMALPEVPGDQWEDVYVTRIGSDVHKLWRAIKSPSAAGLKVLIGATGKATPVVQEQSKLEEVGALLDDAQELMRSVLKNGSRD
jgi:hypothetical protein